MFIVSFDIKNVILENWAPDEVTVNPHYYNTDFESFTRKVQKKVITRESGFLFHQDDVPAHAVLTVKFRNTNRSTYPCSLFTWSGTMWHHSFSKIKFYSQVCSRRKWLSYDYWED